MHNNSRRSTTLTLIALFTLTTTAACDGRDGGGDGDPEPVPAAPAVSDELHALGQALFFDKILSGNQDIACATCHHPRLGTDDDLALSLGVGGTGLGAEREGGAIIPRNAPALFNLHAYETMFWDSRVSRNQDGQLITPAGAQLTAAMEQALSFDLVAAQAMFPVTSAEEMRGAPGSNELADLANDDFTGIWSGLMARLGAIPEYVAMFESAYPGTAFGDMTFAHAANAIAGFEIRAFARMDSPYQRFLEGDDAALTDQQLDGMDDFFDAGCGTCHGGPLLSDFRHHNTALAQFGPGKGHGVNGLDDFGREGITNELDDRYEFRSTPLINVELTAPFGHSGQFATLRDFVAHYRDHDEDLREYEIQPNVDQPELWDTLLPNTTEILSSVSRRVRNLDRFNVDDVVAFLQAATADSARDLSDTIPASVPSGLPVD